MKSLRVVIEYSEKQAKVSSRGKVDDQQRHGEI